MRDSLSAFDQVRAFAGDTITADDVVTVLGLIGRDLVLDMLEAVDAEDAPAAFALVERAIERGYDLRLLCRELARATRDLLILSVDPARAKDTEVAAEGERERLQALAGRSSREDLLRAFDELTRAEQEIKTSDEPRYNLEMSLLRLMHLRKLIPLADLITGAAGAPGAIGCVGCGAVHRCAGCTGAGAPGAPVAAPCASARTGAPRRARTCAPHPSHRSPHRAPAHLPHPCTAPHLTHPSHPSAPDAPDDRRIASSPQVKVGEGVLLQHRRRPGLSGGRDAGADHVHVSPESEGAESSSATSRARGSRASPNRSSAARCPSPSRWPTRRAARAGRRHAAARGGRACANPPRTSCAAKR